MRGKDFCGRFLLLGQLHLLAAVFPLEALDFGIFHVMGLDKETLREPVMFSSEGR